MSEQSSLFATEYKSIPAQIGVDEAQGIVECFVAGIGNKDSVGDICLPNCFGASLKRRKPRVVWGHNWNEPIGKVLEIYEVPPNDPRLPLKMKRAGIGGLFAKVQFNLRSERGREAFNNVAFFGEEQEWSIGYKTLDAVFDPVQQANLLKEVELYEVSPVLHGANQLTGTISIKSDDPESKADSPCWPGYQQVGMKKGKNGKMVPNCVPSDPEGKSADLKDPKGGLTPAGRKYFKQKEGANLKPGVKGPADTPEKMRRKGSFLTRFYTNPSGPLVGKNGKPTRLALAAAAWGEPVPKNKSDAAELAAKGRRLLERYQNVKKKGHPSYDASRIYSGDEEMNPAFGRVNDLAKAVSQRFGGKVKIRTADKNMVIFDLMNDFGDMQTIRVGYHYEDGEFMFGNAETVKPETIYMPVGKPSNMPGNAYVGDADDDFGSAFGGVAMKPAKGDCGCGCGGGKSYVIDDMPSWDAFKSENPGIHLFIQSESELDELLEVASTVAKYHGFDIKSLEDGLVVPNSDSMSEEGYEALLTAINFLEEKAVGRKLRRMGRMATDRFDPNAIDGDEDGLVQDSTPFERPNAPRMMPPMNPPRKVPEPAREPIRPPVRPSVPSPAPTPAPGPRPERPVPVGSRTSGSMARGKPTAESVMRQAKKIGDQIWKMRTEDGMSLDDVAQRMNMTRAQVRQIEMRVASMKRRTEGDNPKDKTPRVSGAISNRPKPQYSGFSEEARKHLEKFGWSKDNKTPSFDTRGSRVLKDATYDKESGTARFTLINGRTEEHKVSESEAERIHANSVLEPRPANAVEDFLDDLRSRKNKRSVSGSMTGSGQDNPDKPAMLGSLMRFDTRGSRRISDAAYDPQTNRVIFNMGDGSVEQYELDYDAAKKFGARSGKGLDDMLKQLQGGKIGKRVLTRQQNQSIDWARKNRGFQIVQSILERFDNGQISTADLNRLQQLWRDYGNRR